MSEKFSSSIAQLPNEILLKIFRLLKTPQILVLKDLFPYLFTVITDFNKPLYFDLPSTANSESNGRRRLKRKKNYKYLYEDLVAVAIPLIEIHQVGHLAKNLDKFVEFYKDWEFFICFWCASKSQNDEYFVNDVTGFEYSYPILYNFEKLSYVEGGPEKQVHLRYITSILNRLISETNVCSIAFPSIETFEINGLVKNHRDDLIYFEQIESLDVDLSRHGRLAEEIEPEAFDDDSDNDDNDELSEIDQDIADIQNRILGQPVFTDSDSYSRSESESGSDSNERLNDATNDNDNDENNDENDDIDDIREGSNETGNPLYQKYTLNASKILRKLNIDTVVNLTLETPIRRIFNLTFASLKHLSIILFEGKLSNSDIFIIENVEAPRLRTITVEAKCSQAVKFKQVLFDTPLLRCIRCLNSVERSPDYELRDHRDPEFYTFEKQVIESLLRENQKIEELYLLTNTPESIFFHYNDIDQIPKLNIIQNLFLSEDIDYEDLSFDFSNLITFGYCLDQGSIPLVLEHFKASNLLSLFLNLSSEYGERPLPVQSYFKYLESSFPRLKHLCLSGSLAPWINDGSPDELQGEFKDLIVNLKTVETLQFGVEGGESFTLNRSIRNLRFPMVSELTWVLKRNEKSISLKFVHLMPNLRHIKICCNTELGGLTKLVIPYGFKRLKTVRFKNCRFIGQLVLSGFDYVGVQAVFDMISPNIEIDSTKWVD